MRGAGLQEEQQEGKDKIERDENAEVKQEGGQGTPAT
jgi:hypothetical protein